MKNACSFASISTFIAKFTYLCTLSSVGAIKGGNSTNIRRTTCCKQWGQGEAGCPNLICKAGIERKSTEAPEMGGGGVGLGSVAGLQNHARLLRSQRESRKEDFFSSFAVPSRRQERKKKKRRGKKFIRLALQF